MKFEFRHRSAGKSDLALILDGTNVYSEPLQAMDIMPRSKGKKRRREGSQEANDDHRDDDGIERDDPEIAILQVNIPILVAPTLTPQTHFKEALASRPQKRVKREGGQLSTRPQVKCEAAIDVDLYSKTCEIIDLTLND